MILINTYMPTEGCANAEYEEILDEVREIERKFEGHDIIWTGDINASISRSKPTKNDQLFREFCEDCNLTVSDKMPNDPTFHHFNGTSTSQIDLFIHRLTEKPIKYITLSRNPLNTSMHDPITASSPQRYQAKPL